MSDIPEIDKVFDDFLKSEIKWKPVTMDAETIKKIQTLFEAGEIQKAQDLILETLEK